MGRPPLNVKPIVVRLSVEMIARIDAVAGKHRRSQFLREMVEAELLRREASAAIGDKPKPKKGSK
jgi:predicted DNA-binding protein